MSNQYIDIEAFAHLSGLSVNTVRRKIKTLSETDKNAFIHRVPVVGRGGEKILIDKALIKQWVINSDTMSNQETGQNPVDESLSNQEKETIQEQMKTPEDVKNAQGDDKKENGSSENYLTDYIESLKKRIEDKDREIEHLKTESDLKSNQIAYFVNKISKLETTLQLNAPKEQTPGDVSPRRWWHLFWK